MVSIQLLYLVVSNNVNGVVFSELCSLGSGTRYTSLTIPKLIALMFVLSLLILFLFGAYMCVNVPHTYSVSDYLLTSPNYSSYVAILSTTCMYIHQCISLSILNIPRYFNIVNFGYCNFSRKLLVVSLFMHGNWLKYLL